VRATAKDKDGLNPLHRALCQPLPRVALTPLERGADATAPDNKGRTPLHRASSEGHFEVIPVVLDRGAETKARDNEVWARGVYEGDQVLPCRLRKFEILRIVASENSLIHVNPFLTRSSYSDP